MSEGMGEITAGMVRELRDKTDAPMMECKKALVEAGGNPAKAEELLRIRLGNKACKAATRTAARGVGAGFVAPRSQNRRTVEGELADSFLCQKKDEL